MEPVLVATCCHTLLSFSPTSWWHYCTDSAAKGILTETHKNREHGAESRAGRLDYIGAQGLVKDFVFYLENQEKSLNYSLGKCKIKLQ